MADDYIRSTTLGVVDADGTGPDGDDEGEARGGAVGGGSRLDADCHDRPTTWAVNKRRFPSLLPSDDAVEERRSGKPPGGTVPTPRHSHITTYR